jgi:hypothetical protein
MTGPSVDVLIVSALDPEDVQRIAAVDPMRAGNPVHVMRPDDR